MLKTFKQFRYPLITPRLYKDDIQKGISVLKSGQITMSKLTVNFEKAFAKYIGAKYAVMVNSGSSANLLATAASCNPIRTNKFKRGDEVLIPGICWSTSLWPLIQFGLKPVFVDIDPLTLNIDINDLKKKVTKKTKVIFCVHVLGNSSDVSEIKKIAKLRKLILIEDTCESLGSKLKNKNLGTFGDFGTFSFYYSHQISSGEGGMVICNNKKDYNLLKSLRAHGWSRDGDDHNKYVKKYPKIDPRFIFINYGFNVRALEIQAAIAHQQLKKINFLKKNRIYNRSVIIKTFKNIKRNNHKIHFIESSKNVECNWFGIPMLVSQKLKKHKQKIVKLLEINGIETRPIISGNFLNQPAIKLFGLNKENIKLKNCQDVEDRGFYIGVNSLKTKKNDLIYVSNVLNKVLDNL
ncbi:DegT/DnrJ/EryC1/StrS family aminotransferase [Candidatus Pelagibacter sp. Uisw_130]|uniref:DegT/DnrJ/EryC1/StrS family aminotransferase n=1 Tax=Candidatus Pelagibacter sp. Uisw_130 TaxID=3230989 RepID=UPI0039EB7231